MKIITISKIIGKVIKSPCEDMIGRFPRKANQPVWAPPNFIAKAPILVQ